MRRPVTPDEMTKYKARQMSADELKEFDANLSEAGLAREISPVHPGHFISALRPDTLEDAFDTETLLSFVKGELDASTRSRIADMRLVDSDLDETLSVMEGAKRQVDASLEASPPQARVKTRKSWFLFGGLGFGAACLAILSIGLLRPASSHNSTVASIDHLIHSSSSGTMSAEAVSALQNGSIKMTNEAQAELASLSSASLDKVKMTPASCLVLPSGSTNLTWNGIKSKNVKCRLIDSKGTMLAEANVMQGNTWNYGHELPTGDFSWTVEWVNVKGETKSASRRFRVVDEKRAKEVADELTTTPDAVSRAVVLAKNGFTAQSLELIDSIAKSKQAAPGLQKLRDSIAATGQGAMA